MRDDQMSLAELRRQVPPEVYRAVEEAVNKGWTLRKQGHKAYLYCPCEQGGGKCGYLEPRRVLGTLLGGYAATSSTALTLTS